jgi:hypothetical protein
MSRIGFVAFRQAARSLLQQHVCSAKPSALATKALSALTNGVESVGYAEVTIP